MSKSGARTESVPRRVTRAAAAVLRLPVGMAFALLYAAMLISPRRVPALARFIRTAEFRELQSAAAAWADQNFELIEARAPWLDRVGCWVFDRCDTRLEVVNFSVRPPSLGCIREVCVVYGVDGGLQTRRTELANVLIPAGWGDDRFYSQDFPVSIPEFWGISWSAGHRSQLPAILQTTPPHHTHPMSLHMRIAWVSRGQPAEDLSASLGSGNRPPTATAIYRPVDISGTDFMLTARQALTRHEHAIALKMVLYYYGNSNVNARPHRVRKRLVPAWWIRSS